MHTQTHVHTRRTDAHDEEEEPEQSNDALRRGKDVWALHEASQDKTHTCQDGEKMDEKKLKDILSNARKVVMKDEKSQEKAKCGERTSWQR